MLHLIRINILSVSTQFQYYYNTQCTVTSNTTLVHIAYKIKYIVFKMLLNSYSNLKKTSLKTLLKRLLKTLLNIRLSYGAICFKKLVNIIHIPNYSSFQFLCTRFNK